MVGKAWRLWAHSIGVKPAGLTNREADVVATFRTVVLLWGVIIPATCIIANTGRTFGIW